MDIESLVFDSSKGIQTSANATPLMIRITGDGSGEPKLKDGAQKMSPDGRPVYTVKAEVLVKNRAGKIEGAKNIYVNSIDPVFADFDVFRPTLMVAQGKMFVLPFADNNGRVAYSITVEKFTPLAQGESK